MNWMFKRSPALLAAGLLACTALACGDATDTSPDDTSSQRQTLEEARQIESTRADADERGNLDELARLAANADLRSLDEVLPALYAVRGPVQLVTQGPIVDYTGNTEPVYVRHANSPELHLMIAAGHEIKLALRDAEGRLHEVGYELEEVEGGLAELRIVASDLPAAGILLLGGADAELERLGEDVFALAVVDEPRSCEGAERDCADDDVACMIQAHSTCITSSFDALPALQEDASPSELITNYMEPYSPFERLSVASFDEERGTVNLTWGNDVRPEKVVEIRADGSQHALEFRQIEERAIQVIAPEHGFSPDALIALQSPGGGIENTGIAIAPIFGWFFPDKTWKYSGCLRFENQAELSSSTTTEILHDIDVRVTTSIGGGIYLPWMYTRTDSNGCFSTSKTFTGMFASAKRYARIQYRLRDGNFASWDVFSNDGIFRGGFSTVRQTARLSHSSSGYNAGAMTIAPGQPGALGEEEHRRRAVAFDAMRHIDQVAGAQNSWLRFNGPVFFNYPIPFDNIGVAPPNPANVLEHVNPFPTAHRIFLSANVWSFATAVHEIAHTWHYKHKSGNIPNIISSLVDGWDTHNCQEDDNVAFLEGFAEYFAQQALCGGIFDSGHCNANYYTSPLSMQGLYNDYNNTCATEGEPPLDSVSRVIRHDDGVTHGLQLLTADNFYQRNFQSIGTIASIDSGIVLPAQCYWGKTDYDFWDVLWAFKADPSKGYHSHFPISQGNDLLDFMQRFSDVHEAHTHFLPQREPFLNPLHGANPSQSCFKRCSQPAVMHNGQLSSAFPVNNHCDVAFAPTYVNVSVSGRNWYTEQTPNCPVGNYDDANCHVLTPHPDVEPFIYNGHLYTTALPGDVCPDGWFDGENCQIAQPIPGHQPFIWEGMLYFTATYGCLLGSHVGSNICHIGTTPPGTTAAVTGNNMLSYFE